MTKKKIIKVYNGSFVRLMDLLDLLDVEKIHSYKIKNNLDGTLILKFYDKKRKLVKPYDLK